MHEIPFIRWVANSIAECGGNPSMYLLDSCGFAGKDVLTYSASGIQHLSSDFFFDKNQVVASSFAVVPTDLQTLH